MHSKNTTTRKSGKSTAEITLEWGEVSTCGPDYGYDENYSDVTLRVIKNGKPYAVTFTNGTKPKGTPVIYWKPAGKNWKTSILQSPVTAWPARKVSKWLRAVAKEQKHIAKIMLS